MDNALNSYEQRILNAEDREGERAIFDEFCVWIDERYDEIDFRDRHNDIARLDCTVSSETSTASPNLAVRRLLGRHTDAGDRPIRVHDIAAPGRCTIEIALLLAETDPEFYE